jgi:hypothetical protein
LFRGSAVDTRSASSSLGRLGPWLLQTRIPVLPGCPQNPPRLAKKPRKPGHASAAILELDGQIASFR